MINLNIEYEEIFPRIFVYKNLLPRHSQLYSDIKKIEESSNGNYLITKWTDWFTYGTYCNVKNYEEIIDSITDSVQSCTKHEEYLRNIEAYMLERNVVDTIQSSNCIAISHYIGINNVKLPDKSYITKPNIAKYVADVMPNYSRNDSLAMQFHTDYRLGEWYWPQDNFLLTCTTYINDDYSGGEIIFSVKDNFIPYKPKAGEILVFPSGSPLYPESPNRQPYFHATNSVKNNPKYFIRNYVTYEYEGDSTWFENAHKYGENWKEIAKDRSQGHNLIIVEYDNGKTFDLENHNQNTSVTKYGSNLIPHLYDVEENEYLFYEKLYKYDIF